MPEEVRMILVNTDFISGQEIKTLQLVKGSSVRSRNIGRDLMAGLKTIVGGELKGYSDMINEARSIATERMILEARDLGADGIINVRYGSSSVMQGAAEIIVYGTAVKFV